MTEAENILERLAAFIRRRGGRCFAGWDAEILNIYLKWHAVQQTLVYVSQGERIVGLMTVRKVRSENLGTHWRQDADGDCLWVENAIATRPGVMRQLVERVQMRFPEWATLRIVARRGKRGEELVEYSPAKVRKIMKA